MLKRSTGKGGEDRGNRIPSPTPAACEAAAGGEDLRLIPCMNDTTGTEVTTFFIDWLLIDPASWRFHPAKLFIESMEEFCD